MVSSPKRGGGGAVENKSSEILLFNVEEFYDGELFVQYIFGQLHILSRRRQSYSTV